MPESLETPTTSHGGRRHQQHDPQQYSSRDRHQQQQQQQQQQPPPVQPRSKRTVPSPSLNSLRSSFSQVSLDEGYSNNSASTSSLSLHLPQRQHKQDSGVDLQEMPHSSKRSNRDFRIIPPDEMAPIDESIVQPRMRPSQSTEREHKEHRNQRDQRDHRETRETRERRERRDRDARSTRDTSRGTETSRGTRDASREGRDTTRDREARSTRNASREDTQKETRERDRGPSSRAVASSSSSRRGLYTLSNNSSGNLLSLEGSSSSSPSLPLLQISVDKNSGQAKDEEDSYFGDILDKYCNSDDDPTSPSTASPTSPFSSAGWKDYRAQPPTPPASSSRQFNLNQAIVPPRRSTPLRNQRSVSPQDPGTHENDSHNTGSSLSPMLAASAKFNMYLHAGAKDSKDSLAKSNGSSQGSSSGQSPLPSARSYTKRPPPVPKDSPSPSSSTTPSPRASAVFSSSPMTGVNRSTPDLRSESRPEPPPKDRSRAVQGAHSNGSMSQLPLLTLESQSSNGQFSAFSSVVEASMNRHKTLSVASNSSTSPYHHSQDDHPQSRTRSGSNSQSNYQQSSLSDRQSGNYHKVYQNHGHAGSVSSIAQSLDSYDESKYPYGRHSHSQSQSHSHSHHNGSHSSKSSGQDTRSQGSHHDHHHNSPSSGYAYSQKSGQSPSEMLNRRFDDRARTTSQTSTSTTSSRQQSYPSSPNPNSESHGRSGGRLKSALSKTPIARARAREAHGQRKVIFGDMITIVSIERSETPPPPPVANKKDKKKKKDKKGNQGHDPDYDADYYNTPYTPEPAEVVVTLAPWIGNPNYDEEKANSKFYYEDDMDYEYDDYEYETPYENDIRLGPEDEDEDEDEDEPEGRAWGHGIAGGGSVTKKKGGMFKFKKAVNRLLRN
ncbi:hypothetical protein BGZ81_000374 [Podila clonocystis]|nr:hypothetical protein BGZ81_000374 [Podila clonocystis]